MPRYKALKDGFIGDVLYGPDRKRTVVHTDEPLKPVPSWLEKLPDEPVKQKQKRQRKTAAEKKAEAEKQEQDQVEKDQVTFDQPQTNVTKTL